MMNFGVLSGFPGIWCPGGRERRGEGGQDESLKVGGARRRGGEGVAGGEGRGDLVFEGLHRGRLNCHRWKGVPRDNGSGGRMASACSV